MAEAGPSREHPCARTRSGGPVYDPDMVFSPAPNFQSQDQLPTIKSVISLMSYHVEVKNMDRAIAHQEVTKQVYCKWFADTVFCVSDATIERRLTKI